LKEAPADIVHMHLQYSTLLFLPLARFLGLKAVVTLHSPNRKRERWSHRALNRLEVALLRNFADCIIGVGPVVTQAWRDRLGGSTVRTITNAVNIPEGADARPRLDLRAELGTPADSMVFACVASLTPQKNISALIDAFAAARPDMRPIELWLIGDGSQRSALRQKVRDMGPSSEGIRFLGVRDDVDGLLAASDAFVLSSNWEGLPVAMLEAMAHALPVIVPNVGDIATVANSSNAIVTEAGDHDALRRALVRLSQDAGLRTSLGAEARRTVEADYSEAAWLKQLRDLYREIANEGGVR
jgi:glycosyltransferase involved in cell wall biosynthesis